MSATDPEEVKRLLSAPFDPAEVKFKPSVVKGNRALALHYVDARVIQDRLDDVLGVDGWSDDYECLTDGSVVCRLRLKIGGEWITKVDVGGPSEQPDGGDRVKAAFSDAIKRAAVKFGIGRYLYRLPQQWVDYDPQRRQFLKAPSLPDYAKPGSKTAPAAARMTKPKTDDGPRVSKEQASELAKLIGELKGLGGDTEKIKQWYNIQKPSELPADKYDELTVAIRKSIVARKRNTNGKPDPTSIHDPRDSGQAHADEPPAPGSAQEEADKDAHAQDLLDEINAATSEQLDAIGKRFDAQKREWLGSRFARVDAAWRARVDGMRAKK